MVDWRLALKEGLSEAGDQRTSVEEHPLYPLILTALEEVKQELSNYGIWSVVIGSHNGQGASLGIWTPDIYELKIVVLAGDQVIRISATHSKFHNGLIPFAQREIATAGITKDALALETVRIYLEFLRRKDERPQEVSRPIIVPRLRKRPRARG